MVFGLGWVEMGWAGLGSGGIQASLLFGHVSNTASPSRYCMITVFLNGSLSKTSFGLGPGGRVEALLCSQLDQ